MKNLNRWVLTVALCLVRWNSVFAQEAVNPVEDAEIYAAEANLVNCDTVVVRFATNSSVNESPVGRLYAISRITFAMPVGQTECYANYRLTFHDIKLAQPGPDVNCTVVNPQEVFCNGVLRSINYPVSSLVMSTQGVSNLPHVATDYTNGQTVRWIYWGTAIFIPTIRT